MNGYFITDACIGCTLCAKNCPVKAITGCLKEKHTIDPSKCIRCGECGRLCAKGAVFGPDGKPAEKIAKNDRKKPVINVSLCAGCSLCIENCPIGCLTLTEPMKHGDIHTTVKLFQPEKCIGCGLCSDACPISAISMTNETGKKTIDAE